MSYPVQTRPRNGFGIAALSLSIGGLVFCLMPITGFIAVICGALAILFALLGHARYRRHEATNNKMCVTAAFIGVITTAIGVWGVVIFMNAMGDFGEEMEKMEGEFNSSWGTSSAAVPEVAPASPEPSQYTPTADDYMVTLKVISQQCYGSAGCHIEVEPEVTYLADTRAGGTSCDITYTVTGDESGPVIETATGDGVNFWAMSSLLTTSSSSVEPSAEVTDVSCY